MLDFFCFMVVLFDCFVVVRIPPIAVTGFSRVSCSSLASLFWVKLCPR